MDMEATKSITLSIKNIKSFYEIMHEDSTNKDENCNTINLERFIQLLENNVKVVNVNVSHIRVLNLNNCQLKEVPDILNKLNLKELHLSKNMLTVVPTCLYLGLNQLEVLDLSHNLIENFDAEPFCRTSLNYLNIEYNKLKNLPPWILALRCTKLEKLIFNCNKVRNFKSLLNQFSLSVKTLHMKTCCLRNIDFSFLKRIKTLEELDVSNEPVHTADMGNKENIFEDIDDLFVEVLWKNMQVLRINNLSISLFPEGIVWLEHLRVLEITKNSLSWLPDDIEYLINLEEIDVSNNGLSFLPKKLFNLRNIKIIKAANNSIEYLYDISNFIHLEIVDLYNNKLTEFNSGGTIIPYLKFIDLEYNYIDTKSLDNYLIYKEKCNAYRATLVKEKQRCYVYKEQSNYEIVDSDTECTSSEHSECYPPLNCLEVQLDQQENWDDKNKNNYSFCCSEEENEENWDDDTLNSSGKIIKPRHPDITASDDEWRGELARDNIPKISPRIIKKIYNNDWIFCDAE